MKTRIIVCAMAAALVCASLFGAAPAFAATETQGANTRESAETAAVAPRISFITSSNPYCYQPDPAKNECYINVRYTYVDASPNYMIFLYTMIGGKAVERTQGFFDTFITQSYDMHGPGFKVACGSLGESGDPLFGHAYPFEVHARDTVPLNSANYGSIFCPAYVP